MMTFDHRLAVFSKVFAGKSLEELIEMAHKKNFSSYDLCVREGYPVNPGNAGSVLEKAERAFRKEGIGIPMVTGPGDMVDPGGEGVETLLAAMDKSNIRLLKLGYFRFDPDCCDYWQEVEKARKNLAGWAGLARTYNVKICYHTHSNRFLGLNCAALAHLLQGLHPEHIGAYADPCHMVIEGEEFSVGLSMVKEYLSVVALKDVVLYREPRRNHGSKRRKMVPAGEGMVDWTEVLNVLSRFEFAGPLSIHCEFECEESDFEGLIEKEIAFFKGYFPRW